MHAYDGGTQSGATARITPNNGVPQRERRANTTPKDRKNPIEKASGKIQTPLGAFGVWNRGGVNVSCNKLI